MLPISTLSGLGGLTLLSGMEYHEESHQEYRLINALDNKVSELQRIANPQFAPARPPGARQPMFTISDRGRTKRSGLRWQSRHHSICSELDCSMRGIRSTLPWQVTQPTPLAMWMLWLK